MPQRPDLRQISGNIRDALGDCDRETLLDMLTFVFKEYVVEGPPPLLVGQAERIPDLEGLSLAQLIRTLQTRLDLPELGLFQVDGEQVSVRVGGVMTPLDTSRADASRNRGGAEPAAPAAAPVVPERLRAGVHVIEAQVPMQPPRRGGESRASEQSASDQSRGQARDQTREQSRDQRGDQASPRPGAPPPREGLSIRGRPSAGAAAPAPAAREESPGTAGGGGGPAAREPASPAPAQPQSPSGDEDIASTRFSLLELD